MWGYNPNGLYPRAFAAFSSVVSGLSPSFRLTVKWIFFPSPFPADLFPHTYAPIFCSGIFLWLHLLLLCSLYFPTCPLGLLLHRGYFHLPRLNLFHSLSLLTCWWQISEHFPLSLSHPGSDPPDENDGFDHVTEAGGDRSRPQGGMHQGLKVMVVNSSVMLFYLLLLQISDFIVSTREYIFI